MIINVSRATQFQECRQKSYNWDYLRLMAWREAEALMTGEAFHVGIAHYFSTRDVEASMQEAEKRYRERLVGQMVLPEEQQLIETQIELSRRMIHRYSQHYQNEPIQILMPEVKFMIPLPGTEHHCWFIHQIEHPDVLYEECPIESNRKGVHWGDLRSEEGFNCWAPHYFTGKTDAVISWRNMIWLLEHKTAVNTGDIFYKRFRLDKQTTGYLYGIWKATGMRPHGFLLNVIKKPRADVAKRDPFAISFEREPFIRDDATLEEFERDIIMIANDYELAYRTNNIYKNERSCTSYNRECYYMHRCENHQQSDPDEFRTRSMDYVNLAYYELLGLEPPKDVDDAVPVSEAARGMNQ